MALETVLITGASSGIGREFAHCFAADGSRLVLLARRGSELQKLSEELRGAHQTDARVLVADLVRPETPTHVMTFLQNHGLKVDVLVNNAGFGAQGTFAVLPLERQLQMVQVNVMAPTHLARLLLPGMIERRRGGILNVASTAAFQPGPQMAVYYATKAYLLSLSEALAEEAAGTGVAITALCPGLTATGFADAAQMQNSLLLKMNAMSARRVAEVGYRAFRRGGIVELPGWRNRLLAFSVRLAPRSVTRKIAGKFNQTRSRPVKGG